MSPLPVGFSDAAFSPFVPRSLQRVNSSWGSECYRYKHFPLSPSCMEARPRPGNSLRHKRTPPRMGTASHHMDGPSLDCRRCDSFDTRNLRHCHDAPPCPIGLRRMRSLPAFWIDSGRGENPCLCSSENLVVTRASKFHGAESRGFVRSLHRRKQPRQTHNCSEPPRAIAIFGKIHATAPRKIVLHHCLYLAGEPFVRHHHQQLEVEVKGTVVHIDGSNGREFIVYKQRLLVQKPRLIAPQLDPAHARLS